MASFRWSAVTAGGEVVSGVDDAPDQAAIVERLQRQGQIVLSAEPADRRNLFSELLHTELGLRRGVDRTTLGEVTRELAASWGRQGIRVNAIAPGFFHSRLADPAIPLAEPGIAAFSPIPRVGAAGELKGVAVFLAADASNYITGQVIVVDGGWSIA